MIELHEGKEVHHGKFHSQKTGHDMIPTLKQCIAWFLGVENPSKNDHPMRIKFGISPQNWGGISISPAQTPRDPITEPENVNGT